MYTLIQYNPKNNFIYPTKHFLQANEINVLIESRPIYSIALLLWNRKALRNVFAYRMPYMSTSAGLLYKFAGISYPVLCSSSELIVLYQ